MGWGRAERILVVWPEKEQLLNKPLDLMLLKRHGQALGVQLALVTHDHRISQLALQLGMPIYKSLRKAQNGGWRLPHRFRKHRDEKGNHPPSDSTEKRKDFLAQAKMSFGLSRPLHESQSHLITRLVSFTVGVLSFLFIAAIFIPSASLEALPEERFQEIKITASANPEYYSTSLFGTIPAIPRRVIVEGRDALPVSGTIRLPDQPAVGEVEFTNLTDQPLDLPKGLVVVSSGEPVLRFAVSESAQIPPGPGSTLTLPVKCLTSGEAGNLPAGSLIALDGLLGTQLSVTNPLPTHGGTERIEPAPTSADRLRLVNRLRKTLQKTASDEIILTLDSRDLLIPNSLKLVTVLHEKFQPEAEQPANMLQLSLRLEFEALVVSAQILVNLSKAVLDSQLPSGFQEIPGTLTWEHLGDPMLDDNGDFSWQMVISRDIEAHIPVSKAVRLTLGQTPEVALQRLETELYLEGSPKITLKPRWWPRLPILPFRILVVPDENSSR